MKVRELIEWLSEDEVDPELEVEVLIHGTPIPLVLTAAEETYKLVPGFGFDDAMRSIAAYEQPLTDPWTPDGLGGHSAEVQN